MSRFTTVFLDRDGTVNVKAPEGEYVTDPDRLVLLPGAGRAIRRLNDAGLRVVLVSNQRCVALGLASLRQVDAVNERLRELLARDGARLDAVYVCPHEDGVCACRKPLPGLLLQAAVDQHGIELARSVMVGDDERDVLAGRAAGVATVRLGPPGVRTEADVVLADLRGAASWILRDPPFAARVALASEQP